MFKITIRKNKEAETALLPINYQYPVSSWIYKTINQSNPEFAEWLHSKGYSDGKKQFRLFNFSEFFIKDSKIKDDRLLIGNSDMIIYISFYPIEIPEHFIVGLFNNQEFFLGDSCSKAYFHVKNIEHLKEPTFSDKMTFKTISPVLVTWKNSPEDRYPQYLNPSRADHYGQCLLNNLVNKYNTFYGNAGGMGSYQVNNILSEFKVKNTPKSRLITVKSGTPQESKLRAFHFSFDITAPEPLLRLGYYAGFGEKNSLGFGCVEVK